MRIQPALVGGLFIGVVSALPVIGAANACCCLWVVVGGGLTAYVLQQSRPMPVESSEAALQGLSAGAIGALIHMVALWFLISGAIGLNLEEQIRSALERSGDVPPEVRDMVQNLFTGNRFLVLITVVTIPVYAVFSMAGSLLGLMMFKKKTPPAPPAEAPLPGPPL